MKKPIIIILVLITFALVIAMIQVAHADQVTLAWDPVAPAPDEYRIFLRIKGNGYDYSRPAWHGNVTTCTIKGLAPGGTYYFVARAYVGQDESVDSNEVEFTTQALNIKLSEE